MTLGFGGHWWKIARPNSEYRTVYQQDYVLRILTQAVAALKRILMLKQAGEYKEALSLIDQSLHEFLALSSDLVDQLAAGDLIEFLNPGGMMNIHKSMLLAALLKEQGDVYAAQNRPAESHDVYAKSLTVALGSLLKADKPLCLEHRPAVDTLVDKLGPSRTGDDLNDQLSQFYEKVGDSATASAFFRRLLR